jgi:type I restriction enzyme R subunit
MINPSTNSERAVQNRVIKLLCGRNGYEYIGNLKDSENANIREEALRKFLIEHQELTSIQASEAIRKLKEAAACSNKEALYNSNKAVYNTLRYPVSVSQGVGLPNKQVWLIDWKDSYNNIFEIAEEVTVRKQTVGDEHRRPDVVVYINGIAVAIIELKKATVSVEDGINQNWRNQQEGQIPQFFSTAQLLMAGSESQGVYYGTTLTPPKYYLHWKEPAGDGYPYDTDKLPVSSSVYGQKEFPNELDRSLMQMLQPDRLLEFIHDCVVFDGGVKKVARPNQYFAIVAAKTRIKNKQSGIIWHSQGSGKSLTMVWLAQWIRENVDDSRVVIITDRDELDKQIENGFKDAGEHPIRAKSGDHLIKMLEGKNDRKGEEKMPALICTLIHKFGLADDPEEIEGRDSKFRGVRSPEQYLKDLADKLPEGFSAKGNIYVFVDECHRTQGGILNKAMKKIMGEDVMMIGFTGTPLLKADKGKLVSRENFGPWIHTYKFDEAVKDKVILDLRYEARDVEQKLSDEVSFDELFEDTTKKLTPKAKKALQDRWADMQSLFSSKERVNRIVAQITKDFQLIPALRDGWGNAMLVAGSIYQAYRFWSTFQETSLAGKCAVVTSYDGAELSLEDGYSGELKTEAEYKYNTNKKMLGDKTPEDFEEWAKYEFVNHPGSMKLLIVVDKLLTGFDAPAATYLYIDKEMRDHNLFQAICRVNRVNGEKKDYGYIVDYKHLFENIEGAIEDYTNGAFSGYDRTDIEGLLKSKIVEGKKDLDAALERCDRLSEPVKEPKGIDEFFDWFCYDQHKGTEEEHQAEIILNARKREDFYEACYTLVRCYTAIAMQMTEAGYTEEEADKIYLKVKTYDEIRNAISKRCGDYVDLKKFDAEMRALLDDYVVSSRVEVLENLEDFSFLGIIDIKDNGDVEVSDNAEIELGGRKGVAETMAANVRRVINRKRESNPEEYKLFSERINRLLEEYQQEKMEYKELLKSIKALAEELRKGENVDPRINTEGKKALYDNLGKDVDFALKVYDVIDANAAVGFRTSEIRKKKLLIAIQKTLVGTEFDAVKVLNIVIHNPEFGN